MEKIAHYQDLILSLLSEYENSPNTYLIADTQRHHYQILRAGWDKQGRYYLRVRVHFYIQTDGKIALMENRTEDDVAEMLVERGVPKSDIVLALLPEYVRSHTGYAVA